MAAPPPASAVVWDAAKLRFATPDGLAYLQYALRCPRAGGEESAMDLVHTFVPPSKRGLGIAALLCDAAFRHAKQHGFSVIPTCTYVSDTFLQRNPSWKDIVFSPQETSDGKWQS